MPTDGSIYSEIYESPADSSTNLALASKNIAGILKLKATVALFSVAIAGAWFPFPAAGASADAPAGYQDVQFGPTLYRVPVDKYRIGIQPFDPHTHHAALAFSLILPDLKPSTSDPGEAATWGMGTGWHKELHILLEYGMNYISQEQQIENAFRQSAEMKQYVEDEDRRKGIHLVSRFKFLDKNNFTVTSDGCRRYSGYSNGSTIIEICGEGHSLFVTNCDTDIPSPYCEVKINYEKNTQLSYSYAFEFLGIAPYIQARLTDLLNSFRVVKSSHGDTPEQDER